MRWLLGLGALVALVLLAGCAGSGGRVADRRVSDLEPAPGSTVTPPVVLRWSSRIEPDAGLYFAVFLDTSMVPPGQSVLPFADGACESITSCIDRGAIAGPDVFVTVLPSVDPGDLLPGPHRFFVTLVDDAGVRQGDVAWNASFTVEP